MTTQIKAIAIDTPIFNTIKDAVIKAFKLLVNAESVSNGSVSADWYETVDGEITATVTFKSKIDAVDGFAPTYAEGICHIDYSIVDGTDTPERDGTTVQLNYGMYSYNMTWATVGADGAMKHDNGEQFGMDSSVDNEMSCWVIESVLADIAETDPDYQAFLEAVFNVAKKEGNATA